MRVYTDDNAVHSLVIYEWASDSPMKLVKELFDRFSALVGSQPDYVTVSDKSACRQYKYPGFVSRNVITKQAWEGLDYLWLREPENLSEFSAICNLTNGIGRRASFHLDEAFIADAAGVMTSWLGEVTRKLRPTYGFMRSMAYKWQPDGYVSGTVMGVRPTDESNRRADFGYVVRREHRGLDLKFRDIYPVNLISQSHLNVLVDGIPLLTWIENGTRGKIEQTSDVTWKWSLQPLEMQRVRRTMLDSGHLIATV